MNKKTDYFLLFSIFILSLVSILFNREIYQQLNENKILYLYSLLPQTLGAIYGLTITGYIFFIGNQHSKASNDPTLHEIIEESDKEQFSALKTLSILVFLSIFFCISTLFLHNKIEPHFDNLSTITVSLANSFAIATIISNFLFIINIIDPTSIEKTSNKIINKIENQENENNKAEDNYAFMPTSQFLKEYHALEELARNIINDAGFSDKNNKNGISRLNLKHLHASGIIKNTTAQMLGQLRKYRNALVHSEPVEHIHNSMNRLLKATQESLNQEHEAWVRQRP
ncbi:hypothetical protein [Comamonas sp. CMM02]|uniref:hypothetical protein n=1 Tax=Comamonas sp. CMM02 TaxID=2769307 RepID=UPI00177D771B|nr:hypothetical protein [Comamonas sp. CMM02]MBD9403149.1 hypothetical protein [Comamonas sp. CMM02]